MRIDLVACELLWIFVAARHYLKSLRAGGLLIRPNRPSRRCAMLKRLRVCAEYTCKLRFIQNPHFALAVYTRIRILTFYTDLRIVRFYTVPRILTDYTVLRILLLEAEHE